MSKMEECHEIVRKALRNWIFPYNFRRKEDKGFSKPIKIVGDSKDWKNWAVKMKPIDENLEIWEYTLDVFLTPEQIEELFKCYE